MLKISASCLFAFYLFCLQAKAQPDLQFLKSQLQVLAAPEMYGRGCTDSGVTKAAIYLDTAFRKAGLQPLPQAGNSYFQDYFSPVNTFPGRMLLRINRKALVPGRDFMVHPSSQSADIRNKRIQVLDVSNIRDSLHWAAYSRRFKPQGVYLLVGIDTIMRYGNYGIRSVARIFPPGFYLLPMHTKLSWLATAETIPGTIVYLEDSVLPKHPRHLSANMEAHFLPALPLVNVCGYVQGRELPDSFVVFTAHYDHLGEMGKGIIFPGANDNASGVAMILLLANYFSRHPARYSIAFLAFSGEEIKLLGSVYYAGHPVFPLADIRFLINIDMAGDASKGITAVNATVFEKQFALLQKLNAAEKYLPAVLSRGPTKNSDHFPFYEKQVPCFFIYSNGLKPYYHDLRDTPAEVNFENAEGFAKLMEKFVLAVSGDLPGQ